MKNKVINLFNKQEIVLPNTGVKYSKVFDTERLLVFEKK